MYAVMTELVQIYKTLGELIKPLGLKKDDV